MEKEKKVAVKTLDSNNYDFTYTASTTVKKFKEKISSHVGVPSNLQRLIFRGRVLQDTKKLEEYGVADNTIHLVQRSPNQNSGGGDDPAENNSTRSENQTNLPVFDGRNAIIMRSIGMTDQRGPRPPGAGYDPAEWRLRVGNQMLNRASDYLNLLEQPGEEQGFGLRETEITDTEPAPMDVDMDLGGGEVDMGNGSLESIANAASAAFMAALGGAVNPNATNNAPNMNNPNPPISQPNFMMNPIISQINLPNPRAHASNSAPNATPATGPGDSSDSSTNYRRPRLREYAVAIQDILAFQARFNPVLRYMHSILKEGISDQNQASQQNVQYIFETMQSTLHALGHAYHAFSEIMCNFSVNHEDRRLSAPSSILVEQSTVIRASIPMLFPMMMDNRNNPNSNTASNPSQPTPNAQGNNEPSSVNSSRNNPQETARPGRQGPPDATTSASSAQSENMATAGGASPVRSFSVQQDGITFNVETNAPMHELNEFLGPGMMGVAALSRLPNPTANQSNRQRPGVGVSATTPAGISPNQGVRTPSEIGGEVNTETGRPYVNSRPRQSLYDQSTGPQIGAMLGGGNANTNTPRGHGIGPNVDPHRHSPVQLPFDTLLPCYSNHDRGARSRQRPSNLQNSLDWNSSGDNIQINGSSADFFEACTNLIQCSDILEMLQPIFKDVITNYLMRGRDIKNSNHIKTCANRIARKLTNVLDDTMRKIPEKHEKFDYQKMAGNVISNFIATFLDLSANCQTSFKREVIVAWEKFIRRIIGISLIVSKSVSKKTFIHVFSTTFVDTFLVGMPVTFRRSAISFMVNYLDSFSQTDLNDMEKNEFVAYKQPESTDSTGEVSVAATPPKRGDSQESIQPHNSRASEIQPLEIGESSNKNKEKLQQSTSMFSTKEEPMDSAERAQPGTSVSSNPDQAPLQELVHQLPTEWRGTIMRDLMRQVNAWDEGDSSDLSEEYRSLFTSK